MREHSQDNDLSLSLQSQNNDQDKKKQPYQTQTSGAFNRYEFKLAPAVNEQPQGKAIGAWGSDNWRPFSFDELQIIFAVRFSVRKDLLINLY